MLTFIRIPLTGLCSILMISWSVNQAYGQTNAAELPKNRASVPAEKAYDTEQSLEVVEGDYKFVIKKEEKQVVVRLTDLKREASEKAIEILPGSRLLSASLHLVGKARTPLLIYSTIKEKSRSFYSVVILNKTTFSGAGPLESVDVLKIVKILDRDEPGRVLSVSMSEAGGILVMIGKTDGADEGANGFRFKNVTLAHTGLCDFDKWIVTELR